MKWSFGAALGVGVALALAGPALAADNATMQIEGMPGGGQEIALTSWSYDAGAHMGGAATGRAAGRTSRGDIHITKKSDSASAKLMQAAATGRSFQKVTISIRKAGAEPYLVYKLTDVMISGYHMAGEGGAGQAEESMTLDFGKIEIVDHSQTSETGVTRAGMIPRASHLPPPGN